MNPDIEVEALHGSLAEGTYRGHAGLYRLLEDFWIQFDERRSEVEECIDAGDDVFTSVLHSGRGKGSGAVVEWRHWHLWTVRSGKIIRWRIFATREQALDAAGLEE
jgi:ketosteroid isomerase-like protein